MRNQGQPQSRLGRRQLVVMTIFLLGVLPFGKAVLGAFDDFGFWWLALLTIATSLFGIRLPLKPNSGAVTVTVGDCFIFLSLFLYGIDAAVVAGVLDAVTVCLKVCGRSLEKLLFNVGQMTISVFVAGTVFWQTQSGGSPLEIGLSNLVVVAAEILAAAVLYYALSSFMIGIVVASCGELPMGQLFRDYLLKLSPVTLLSVAAALAVLLPLPNPLTILLAAVLLGASYLWTRRRAMAVAGLAD